MFLGWASVPLNVLGQVRSCLSKSNCQQPPREPRPLLLLPSPQIFSQNSKLSYCIWNPALETLSSNSKSWLPHTL